MSEAERTVALGYHTVWEDVGNLVYDLDAQGRASGEQESQRAQVVLLRHRTLKFEVVSITFHEHVRMSMPLRRTYLAQQYDLRGHNPERRR